MCGITGFWSANGLDNEAPVRLQSMVKTLYHRGPDGYGYHLQPEKGIAMAHARLSIIDLETGEQPLYSPDKKQVLTVNGEFYNYKKIRTQLRLEGFRFTTKSDSEIALPLYKKHGLDFVHHLRGEFAIVLYDEALDRLVMVRDRFGIKPLFYYINGDKVCWGSEIKALFRHPDIPRSFDPAAVLHQLMQTMVPGTTAFQNIHALKPGHMIVIERAGQSFTVQDHKYWDMDFPGMHDRDDRLTEEDHIERTREKLTEAVALRLEADVPVGCYLSGGIDSCSMLGLASSMQQSPVKAFTISFDNKAYDEADIARSMAEKVGADQEQIRLTAADLYGENYIKTIWHAERTFYNTLGVAKWCMSRRVNECGYRVVVTGEGSDELFGGYPSFKRDMLLHGYAASQEVSGKDQAILEGYKAAMEKSNKLFHGAMLSDETVSHSAMDQVCGFTPSWLQPWMQTLSIARPLLHPDILKSIEGYDPIAAIAENLDVRQMEGRHPLDIAQYTWCKTMLECQILNWGGDRVDMAHSMESRPAFLDHHVAEMALAIPPHMRIRGNTEKWVLREAMKNILPRVLYEREKFAFMSPPAHTEVHKQNALQKLIDEYLNPDALLDTGLFDINRIQRFLEEYKMDKDPVSLVRKDALINHIIGLQVLHRQFISVAVGQWF